MLNTTFKAAGFAFLAGLTQGVETPATTASEVDFAFATHLAKFGTTYSSMSEFAERKSLFMAKDAKINAHNALASKGEYSFTLGHNQFSTWTKSEYEAILTAKPSPKAQEMQRKMQAKALENTETLSDAQQVDLSSNSTEAPGWVKAYDTTNLAASLDWRNEGAVAPIQDQGQCGSCWTYMTMGALEGAQAIAGGNLTVLSEQQLLDCVPQSLGNDGCSGGQMGSGWNYLMYSFAILDSEYPYTSNVTLAESACAYATKNKTDIEVSNWNMVLWKSGDQIKSALADGPVGILINANTYEFNNYQTGIFACSSDTCGTEESDLDHAVLLVGYGTDETTQQEYFILKNSWGTVWGMDGYMLIWNEQTGNGESGMFLSPGIPQTTYTDPTSGNSATAIFFSGAIAAISLLLAF